MDILLGFPGLLFRQSESQQTLGIFPCSEWMSNKVSLFLGPFLNVCFSAFLHSLQRPAQQLSFRGMIKRRVSLLEKDWYVLMEQCKLLKQNRTWTKHSCSCVDTAFLIIQLWLINHLDQCQLIRVHKDDSFQSRGLIFYVSTIQCSYFPHVASEHLKRQLELIWNVL